jgi:tetratricopeptide (TPR) repeat protein
MKRLQIFILSFLFTVSLGWFSSISSKAIQPTAPLLTGMGTHHHTIKTKSPLAQRYNEPADWSIPVRQYLGAALLKAKHYDAAEKVYREDLAIYPDNGWSLYGLSESLQAQNKNVEAKDVQQKFEFAWQYADVQLTASKF